MKWDEQVMKESFYLSNICPQNPNLNGGVWKDLEEQVRDLAIEKGKIFVVCGPIVNNTSTTIGVNKVVVPQAFYKVLLQENNGEIHTIGFVYENVSGRKPMSTYAMSVDEVEKLTKIDFFPSLPDKIENKAEAEVDFSKWTVNTEYQRTVNTGTKDKVENTETKSKSTENLEDKAFKILKTIIENI